jgi:hypothetical protein
LLLRIRHPPGRTLDGGCPSKRIRFDLVLKGSPEPVEGIGPVAAGERSLNQCCAFTGHGGGGVDFDVIDAVRVHSVLLRCGQPRLAIASGMFSTRQFPGRAADADEDYF